MTITAPGAVTRRKPRKQEAAEEIGQQDGVEGSEIGRQVAGVGLAENGCRFPKVGREAVVLFRCSENAVAGDARGGVDEAARKIEADDLVEALGEHEAAARDGAAEVEGSSVAGGVAEQEFGAAAGVAEKFRRRVVVGEIGRGIAFVVEGEVLFEEGVAFVHAQARRLRM
jgi:hypothetical protein